MRREGKEEEEEEEEEFAMATKRVKSNNVANCTSCSQPP
jgi:hypothetical protein